VCLSRQKLDYLVKSLATGRAGQAGTGAPDGTLDRDTPPIGFFSVSGRIKDMDRWLGDGGMELIGQVGASFDSYGVDGEDLGWVEGTFTPEALAGNPHGIVQAGVHALLLDAAMNFAINASLAGRDRTRATLEMKTETMRPAMVATAYRLRGEVARLARQVAYGEATVRDVDNHLISRSTGTFLLYRDEASGATRAG
jgi:acyl-coenzyme A thioesterase PaaI-like protein